MYKQLNRSLKGFDKRFESCFRSILLILSGHAAFPNESVFKVPPTLIPVSAYF